MRKLIVLVALSLSASAAWAQAPGAATVTKLPGEEKLSVRERAERDFLMPVRRKKAAELAKQQPTASAEQLTTAAPENDALSTYSEAAPDPRPEEVAVAHEARTTRSRLVRHSAYRTSRAAEARSARRTSASRRTKAKHASKTSKAAKTSKATARTNKAAKAKAHRSTHKTTATKKTVARKATSAKHKAATKSKRPAAAKVKTKAKPARRKRH